MSKSVGAELSGQTVVLIGGSAGIGLETARRARAEGASVILTGRNPERLAQAAAELGALSSAAFDAADPAALDRFFKSLPAQIVHALRAGARGYLLKGLLRKELLETIRAVHAGQKRIPPEVADQIAEHAGEQELTARQLEVLQSLAQGNRNKDIGDQLFISEDTVKVHVKHIIEKLGANDRTHAVAIAVRRGIIRL